MLVNELMARARRLSLDLRPAMLDDLGLLPTLLWHIEHYTAQTRVRVTLKSSGLEGRRFAPEDETAAYRIAQEGLTNVARHAEVSDATVRVWTDPRALTIRIEDHGKGFDPEAVLAASDTSGLAGMREREVVQLTAEGHTNVEIAARLGISSRTAETHRSNLMHKLNLRTQADLIRYALRRGIIPMGE